MRRKIAEILVDDQAGFMMNILPNVDLRLLEKAMDGLHKRIVEARVRAQIEAEAKAKIIDPNTGQKAINTKRGNGDGTENQSQIVHPQKRDESKKFHPQSTNAHAHPKAQA